MATTLDNINLPSNPDIGAAEVGKDFLLYVNTGTVDVPEWQMIGGQRNSGLTRQAETIDVSHKTSGGWSATKAGLRSWSIDLSGLVLLQDIGVHAISKAFEEGKDVFLKLKYPDNSYRTGWASVTEFSLDIPHDGAATISGTLSGNGVLSALIKDSTASTTSAGGTKV